MGKTKILFVSLSINFAGGETYLEQLVQLLRDDADPWVICIHEEVARRMRDLGIKTYFFPCAKGWRKLLKYPVSLFLLAYLTIRHRIRIVQLNGHAPAALSLPATLLGTRTVLTAHLTLTPRKTFRQRLLLHRRYLASIRFVDTIICVSEVVATELRELFPSKNIITIPNWAATVPTYTPVPEKPHAPMRLLYVGRLVKMKGVSTIIEAMRGIPEVSLTVVGTGQYKPDLEAMAKDMNVTFAGFQSNPKPYYHQTDIFVMPSLGPEGLPMVSIEAMSYGLPCLFSNLPVHHEITDDGQAAVLFKAGDANDLREKILGFLHGQLDRAAYSKAAYEMVLARYSPEAAKRGYLSAFNL